MYIVYMHTCPNGKKYIGITSQAPERRWQKGKGYAYGSNPYFYNAIEKYGWENIKHEILFRDLTKEEAEQKEIELIKEYKTSQRKYGYNIDLGGSSCGKHSEEYKIRMSNMQKEIWAKTPERRRPVGRPVSTGFLRWPYPQQRKYPDPGDRWTYRYPVYAAGKDDPADGNRCDAES